MDPRPVEPEPYPESDPDPLIRGAFDLHLHAASSLFPRWGDVLDTAEAVRRAGMRGFLLKAHHGSSVDGELAPEVRRILEIARDADVAVATGHASAEEILALAEFLTAQRWRMRILVNHVGFRVPDLGLNVLTQLADRGFRLELCAFTVSEMGGARPVTEIARLLTGLPEASWILASDSGQARNPPAPRMLSSYLQELRRAGVPEDLLRRGVQENPVELLGL